MRIISFDLGQSTLKKVDFKNASGFFTSSNWFAYYFNHWPDREKFGFLVHSSNAEKRLADENVSSHEETQTHIAGLAMTRERTRLGMPLRCLHWNYSPTLEQSGIALEANSLHLNSNDSTAHSVHDLLVQLNRLCEWDELRVPVLNFDDAMALANEAQKLGFWAYYYGQNSTYLVDLQSIRNNFNGNVLASLSANSRAQLRKASRLLTEALGPINAAEPQDKAELCHWFEEMALLHERRWEAVNKDTAGFRLKAYKDFYLDLAISLFDSGQLQFLRCTAGQSVVGYLFNIAKDVKVDFLMSGINYQLDSRFKPGMLCQLIAIEKSLAKGCQTYDLLIGSSRYKKSFASQTDKVVSLKIRKKKLRYWPEHWGRQLRGQESLSSAVNEQKSP